MNGYDGLYERYVKDKYDELNLTLMKLKTEGQILYNKILYTKHKNINTEKILMYMRTKQLILCFIRLS